MGDLNVWYSVLRTMRCLHILMPTPLSPFGSLIKLFKFFKYTMEKIGWIPDRHVNKVISSCNARVYARA